MVGTQERRTIAADGTEEPDSLALDVTACARAFPDVVDRWDDEDGIHVLRTL